MLDQKWIRGDLDDLASRLRKKGFELDEARKPLVRRKPKGKPSSRYWQKSPH
jgi:hypothetical protein